MTVATEDKDAAFRKWKEDIQNRCEERISTYPEFKPKTTSPPINQPFYGPGLGAVIDKNYRVEVKQSDSLPSVWHVVINGFVKTSFMGDTAHLRATKYAAELLNGD